MAPTQMGTGYRLRWTDAAGGGGEAEISGPELTIGRSSTAGLVLDDAKVSRLHAKLSVGDTVRLEDLGSRNGTYLNGDGVSTADVRPGDEIRVGGVRITLIGPPAMQQQSDVTIIGTPPADATVVGASPDATVVSGGPAPASPDATVVSGGTAAAAPADAVSGVGWAPSQQPDATRVGAAPQAASPDATVITGAPAAAAPAMAASSEGTVVLEPRTANPESTLVLQPVEAARPQLTRERGIVSDDMINKPVISEKELIDNGVEVKIAEFATLGGGMGSFIFAGLLRDSGVPASEIAVVSNEAKGYGRYRRLVSNSQTPDSERLRSNSDSCPDQIWGTPGYAVREIWREFWRLNWKGAWDVVYKIWGEPTVAPTFTPRTRDVWNAMDREANRIGYDQMLTMGRIRTIRKTEEGRIIAIISQSDDAGRKHVAVSARIVQLAMGYPSLQFLPDLAEFREKHGDREKVVNAYEDHSHVYKYLAEKGGTVVLRGRGIVASRIIQRIFEMRKLNKDIKLIHLHRSKLVKGHKWGPSSRGVEDDFEFQPFNWPKSCWTGQARYALEEATPEKRKELLEVWGGTTTADRPDWKKIVRNGIKEGWYRPEYGVVQEVKPGPEKGVVTRITSSLVPGGVLELPADFIIDCTGLVAAPERAPVLADLVNTYQLPKNPLGRFHVSNEFEIEAMQHANAHMYACGATTLGGPFAAVDSFLGLQYAALRSVRHMHRFHPKGLRRLNGPYSLIQWFKWATGAKP